MLNTENNKVITFLQKKKFIKTQKYKIIFRFNQLNLVFQ